MSNENIKKELCVGRKCYVEIIGGGGQLNLLSIIGIWWALTGWMVISNYSWFEVCYIREDKGTGHTVKNLSKKWEIIQPKYIKGLNKIPTND